jgi:hypothetical protein
MTSAQALAELKKDVALSQRLQDLVRQVFADEVSKIRSQSRGVYDVAALNRLLGKAEGIEDILKTILPTDSR